MRNAGTDTAELAIRFDVVLGSNEKLAVDTELLTLNVLTSGRETTNEPIVELLATRFDTKAAKLDSDAIATKLCAVNEEISGRSTAKIAAGTLLNANRLENNGLLNGSIE